MTATEMKAGQHPAKNNPPLTVWVDLINKEIFMKKKSCIVIIFIMSFLFGQEEEIIHINKTHSDGTPKEVIVYKRVNDDLQSNNPFEIVKKVSYDSKGNWLRPKLQGAAKKAKLMIIGSWLIDKKGDEYIKFNKDGTLEVYNDNNLGDTGVWFLSQIDDIIYINLREGQNNPDETETLKIVNKNEILIDGRTKIRRKID